MSARLQLSRAVFASLHRGQQLRRARAVRFQHGNGMSGLSSSGSSAVHQAEADETNFSGRGWIAHERLQISTAG